MIKEQAIKGIKWTAVASLAANLLQLTQLVIVSRYISAADYGLMALTLVITYFCQLLGDMGISNALIYNRQVSKTAFSTLFWLSLFFCWFIFIVLFFLSPVVAVFFRQPALSAVIRLTATSFIFLPLHMQYLSLLKKDLYFGKIALGDTLSKIIALLVAVILAMNGSGVFSLVYSTLAGLLVATLVYYYFGAKQWTVGFIFKPREIKAFLAFGIYQTGNDILNYFNFQADTLLLGRLLGIDALGFYSFAKNLAVKPAQVINPVITQVAFPLMVKVNELTAAVRNIYLKMIHYLSSVNFIIYPFIVALSDTCIRLFFAERWLPAAPTLQALGVYCMIRSVFNPVGVLLNAQGLVKRLFYWNLVLIFLQPAVVYFAAFAGATVVGLSLALFFVILVIPMCSYLVYPACGVDFTVFLGSIKKPLLNALLLWGILSVYNRLPIHPVALKFSLGLMLWVFSSILLTRFFNKEAYQEAFAILKEQYRKTAGIFTH